MPFLLQFKQICHDNRASAHILIPLSAFSIGMMLYGLCWLVIFDPVISNHQEGTGACIACLILKRCAYSVKCVLKCVFKCALK